MARKIVYIAKIKIREQGQVRGTAFPDIKCESVKACMERVLDFLSTYKSYDRPIYPDIRIKTEEVES